MMMGVAVSSPVVRRYAPSRGAAHAMALLAGYSGAVHCDGYTVYKQLADPQRDGGPVTLDFCWAHWRHGFVKIDEGGPAPIAHEALERIAALYAIENRIRGRCADERRAIRQTETRPLVEALKTWLVNRLVAVSDKSTIEEVIRYGFNHWHGLVRFLDDGRIETDTNSVERAMRPIALNRKNSLFAGHDQGAVTWACIASLIERRSCTASIRNRTLPTSSPNSSMVGRWRRSTNYCPGHGTNKTKSALQHNHLFRQFGGSVSEISCASLASA